MHRTVLAPVLVAALVAAAPPPQQPSALRIVVIEGEGAVNIIQQKTAVAPLVEVRDRNDLPVAGAVVTFSVRGSRAARFAGGNQTVTLTTNAAGRAAASTLTPLTSGKVQIGVEATFQGQTAVTTIAQTNVLTAEAAAASGAASGSAGAANAGGAAAAAGAGGGISATTLAIVGGAVAGGALAARALTSGESQFEGRTFSGPYDTQFVMTVTNPNGTNPCAFSTGYAGTLRMTVRDAAGAASGTAEMAGTKSIVAPGCGLTTNTFFNGAENFEVSGTGGAVSFTRQVTFLGDNNVTVTETISFSGTSGPDSITGTLTIARREVNASETRIGTGGSGVQVTLR